MMKIINLCLVLLFALLLFKDPFSFRTLIPNFEPYPDTFFYINPALNFAKGEDFKVAREGRFLKISVPPLYSISLVPFFIIKKDPRMAYYTNVILAFLSLFFFWLILRKIFVSQLIRYFLLILYITNYFIYWVPSIIMGENLILTLSLAAIYSLTARVSFFNSIVLSFLAVAIYATKYASMPVSASIVLVYLVKIWFEEKTRDRRFKTISLFILILAIFYSIFGIVEWISKGNNIFYQILEHLLRIYRSISHTYVNSGVVGESKDVYTTSWFGVEYIGKNLPLNIKSILGSPNRFLWDYTPLLANYIAIPALIGILASLFIKKFRFISLAFLILICNLIFFISTFYSFDARYIYITIPILLLGFGLFITHVVDKVGANNKMVINFAVLIFIFIYLISNFTRIKSQISLNLRYAETPWNHIAVLKMNEYFTSDKITNDKKPVLISALPPFLIDYYSNRNYTLLPLSYEQEFREQQVREIIWGSNDYSDLPKLYSKYLNEGYDVYVSRSGLGNEGYTNRDFNIIVKEFDTQLVLSGCYDQCNIYSVRLKE